ncbi:hypothetical protein [Pelagibacterium sp. H642]|uniref:hypothetical protein n=1 Tax=Pelagibacterium sp. H642 TaxID=1881069 RepID=UPI002814DA2E|nr:hypothetical protein [Pelagibacterium sp. H642]WMT92627.1 hypothetical protein NO934_19975 [Pelagibacterium sp. H642]
MKSMVERRTEQREAPALRGPAVILLGQNCVEVSIVNASRAGIMIKVPATAAIPDSFTLGIGEHLQACERIWRQGKLLGARLLA